MNYKAKKPGKKKKKKVLEQ